MEITSSNKVINVFRWVVFIPGAVLGAWLAWIILNILGRFSLSYAGVEPESFIAQLYFNTAGHAAMGAAFVYVGAKIAPTHQRVVAYVMSGLGLVLDGFALFPAIMTESGWAIWGAVCVVIGIGAVVYSIHMGETDIE
jgi:hypothetical protein